MAKKIVILILSLISIVFSSSVAFAEDYSGGGGGFSSPSYQVPVKGGYSQTSDYGWRVHPVYGDLRFHDGVDIASTEYDNPEIVNTVGNGIVIDADDSGSGYGNIVMVYYPDANITVLYAHLLYYVVAPNAKVKYGDTLGFMGDTGIGTGVHLHLAVHNGQATVYEEFYSLNTTDPAHYFIGIEEGTNDSFGASKAPSSSGERKYSFDVFYDYAKPVREIITTIVDAIVKGLQVINEKLLNIFLILATIDLAFALFVSIISDGDTNPPLPLMLKKVFAYGVIYCILKNWRMLMGNSMKGFATEMGGKISGVTAEEAAKSISDPTMIIQKGMQLLSPLLNDVMGEDNIFGIWGKLIWSTATGQTGVMVLSFVAIVVIFALLCIVAWQIIRAYLQFYFSIMFGFISMVWSGSKHTRTWMQAHRGIGLVISSTINLLFFCTFSLMTQNMMSKITANMAYMKPPSLSEIMIQKSSDPNGGLPAGADGIDVYCQRLRIVSSGNNYEKISGDCYGAYQLTESEWDDLCQQYENDAKNPPLAKESVSKNQNWDSIGK